MTFTPVGSERWDLLPAPCGFSAADFRRIMGTAPAKSSFSW
jgi:hypothetical protein